MRKLKLGILGLSEGNGHPYSWSAIFNGYDSAKMAKCPFPVIPEYLEKQSFPDVRIKNAEVTHIWTQDPEISADVAEAALIPNIVNDPNDMIGQIDAVLLARDDAENHYDMAEIFLSAGLPIYIDKPIALSRIEAERIYRIQKYPSQIFTCSAFQYSDEFKLTQDMKRKIGDIIYIEAHIKKDWGRYAIHLIEPVMRLIGLDKKILDVDICDSMQCRSVVYHFDGDLNVTIQTDHKTDVQPTINVKGVNGHAEMIITDTFNAFKNALQAFVDGVREKKEMIEKDYVLRCIEMVEMGNEKNK